MKKSDYSASVSAVAIFFIVCFTQSVFALQVGDYDAYNECKQITGINELSYFQSNYSQLVALGRCTNQQTCCEYSKPNSTYSRAVWASESHNSQTCYYKDGWKYGAQLTCTAPYVLTTNNGLCGCTEPCNVPDDALIWNPGVYPSQEICEDLTAANAAFPQYDVTQSLLLCDSCYITQYTPVSSSSSSGNSSSASGSGCPAGQKWWERPYGMSINIPSQCVPETCNMDAYPPNFYSEGTQITWQAISLYSDAYPDIETECLHNGAYVAWRKVSPTGGCPYYAYYWETALCSPSSYNSPPYGTCENPDLEWVAQSAIPPVTGVTYVSCTVSGLNIWWGLASETYIITAVMDCPDECYAVGYQDCPLGMVNDGEGYCVQSFEDSNATDGGSSSSSDAGSGLGDDFNNSDGNGSFGDGNYSEVLEQIRQNTFLNNNNTVITNEKLSVLIEHAASISSTLTSIKSDNTRLLYTNGQISTQQFETNKKLDDLILKTSSNEQSQNIGFHNVGSKLDDLIQMVDQRNQDIVDAINDKNISLNDSAIRDDLQDIRDSLTTEKGADFNLSDGSAAFSEYSSTIQESFEQFKFVDVLGISSNVQPLVPQNQSFSTEFGTFTIPIETFWNMIDPTIIRSIFIFLAVVMGYRDVMRGS